MKIRNVLLLVVALPMFAFGQQPSPVVVSPADKIAIQKAQTDINSLQTEAARIQTTYASQVADVSWRFSKANSAYVGAVESAKKKLGLPPEATFDPASFSFKTPPPAAPIKSIGAPTTVAPK